MIDPELATAYALAAIVGYVVLGYVYYNHPLFSPGSAKADGGKRSPTSHRHAAYKTLLIPVIECAAIYKAYVELGMSPTELVKFLFRLCTDRSFAAAEWQRPLGETGNWIATTFFVAFFLGSFHYYYNKPFQADRVWHKVFSVFLSLIIGLLSTGNRLVMVCVLLWKPAGLAESVFTFIYLAGYHRTKPGKAYATAVTITTATSRFLLEPLVLYGSAQGIVVEAFDNGSYLYWIKSSSIIALVTLLTLLHQKWAFEAISGIAGFVQDRPAKKQIHEA